MNIELTENGIDDSDFDYSDYAEGSDHAKLVHEDDDHIVLADTARQTINELADALAMDRNDLSERMHQLARELTDYDWSTSDPIVIAK